MDFQQIRDFVNPAVAQATGMQEVENLSMPVPVAYVPVQLVIDGALSLTSENPVQNKVIAVAIQNLDGRITAIEGQFSEGVTEAVNNWLAAHPEATTTVQDGAITYAKLDTNLKGEVDQIGDLKSAIGVKSAIANTKTGTTGATYGNYNQSVSIPSTTGSKWFVNLGLSGVELVDATVYGIISAGNYSSALKTFSVLDANIVFDVDSNYIGFYLYVNTSSKGAAYTSNVQFVEIDTTNLIIEIDDIKEQINAVETNVSDIENSLVNYPTMDTAIEISQSEFKTYSLSGANHSWSNKTTGIVVAKPITGANILVNVTINASLASTLYFGVLTIDGTTATIEKVQLLDFAVGKNTKTVALKLDNAKTYYPFIRMVSGTVLFNADSTSDKYYTINASGEVLEGTEYSITTISGNGLYILACEIGYVTSKTVENLVTVAKSGGDYTTISKAVVYAKTIATANSPVTIIIYPGVYDEVVRIRDQKYISLVGINRDTCIIRDTSGKYANSPLLVSGEFSVSNLTIIANHDNAGSWSPTWVVGDNTTFASYCVHCDGAGGSQSTPALGRFFNCRLYSECCNAAGLGLNPYQTLEFDNCVIERYVTDNAYWDDEHYAGAVACHSATGYVVADEHEEHLILKNCVIISNGEKALQLYHYHINSPMDCTAIGCSLQDKNGITNVVRWYRGEESNYITQLSHGNSTAELNYVTL